MEAGGAGDGGDYWWRGEVEGGEGRRGEARAGVYGAGGAREGLVCEGGSAWNGRGVRALS